MYHVSKPVELMECIASVNTDVLVIDTLLSLASGSFLELRRENTEEPRNAVDRALVTVPTRKAVYELVREFGYSAVTLRADFRNESGEADWGVSHDYRDGRRSAFVCAKRSDLAKLLAEVEQ
jgi:hypothetical protein